MITIVMADDHKIVRQGIKTMLESELEFKVLADVPSGEDALILLKSKKPDILLTDLKMPGITGIEVARQAKKISPKTKVIILSMYPDEAYVSEALLAGAFSYVVKEAGLDVLIHAIRETMAGRRYLSPPISSEHIISFNPLVKERLKT